MTVDSKDLVTVVSVTAAIVSIVSLVVTLRRAGRKEIKEDAECESDMRSELKYIARGVDNIQLEQRAQREEMGKIAERLTRCEESAKQAHKRLDGFERREGA